MPLIRIDVVRGRDPSQLRALADTVHEVLMETFTTPLRDRFQVITQHDPDEMILLDTGLGFERSANGVVLIQVIQQGRTQDQKKALYATLSARLAERGLVAPEDLLISISENTRADWSFGFGRAQFLTGELPKK
jgi:phenylpyruvate tautomerase PptA (4-oxalocrotonate tautomerase family)